VLSQRPENVPYIEHLSMISPKCAVFRTWGVIESCAVFGCELPEDRECLTGGFGSSKRRLPFGGWR
jgi:hypothetical protein